MGKRLNLNFQIIWILFFIPLLSFLFLRKTLNLALYGDDWEQLYNLWLSFDASKTLSFFDIRSYLNPYWPQYLFLGIIRHFFSYQPTAYFVFSLFFRIFSSISLFFLIKELTKKSLPAFLASLIFTLSVAGLQTTDWVFNMNAYVGVCLLNIAVIVYLKISHPKKFFFQKLILFIFLFTLALGIVPVRMHGAVIFLGLTEVFLTFFSNKEKGVNIDKYFFIKIITPTIILLLLIKLGSFGSVGDNVFLNSNVSYLQTMIQKGRIDILFYFLGILGNFVLPDTFISTIAINHTILIGFYFLIADSFFTVIVKGGRKLFVYFLLSNTLGLTLAKLMIYWNPLLSPPNILSILIGTHLILGSFIIFWQFKKNNWLPVSLIIIGLIWLVSFSFLYWFRNPSLIIETTSRYLTTGAFGFAILFTGFIWLVIEGAQVQKKTHKLILSIVLLLLLSWLKINFEAANVYLTNLENNRNIEVATKAWSVLLKNVPTLDKEAPSVFYFTTDNSTAIYMIFSFGFPPHGGLLYQIPDWQNTPIPTEHYEELLKMVNQGKILKTLHGRKPIPVPLSKVFAFDFRNGELINITDQVRKQVARDLNLIEITK